MLDRGRPERCHRGLIDAGRLGTAGRKAASVQVEPADPAVTNQPRVGNEERSIRRAEFERSCVDQADTSGPDQELLRPRHCSWPPAAARGAV